MRSLLKTLCFVVTLGAISCSPSSSVSDKKEEKKKALSSEEVMRVVIAGSPHETAHLPFDWSVYEDPSRPEFWADGDDGIMPRPFLYLAGEPTIENAKKLLAWKKRQWAAIDKVVKALGGAAEVEQYESVLGVNPIELAAGSDPLYKLAAHRLNDDEKIIESSNAINWRQVKIVYVYRTSCVHCRNNKDFIDLLEKIGADVMPLQLDAMTNQALYADSKPYTAQYSEYFPISSEQATPTFFIKYGDKKAFSHVGVLRLAQLSQKIKNLEKMEANKG